MGSRVVAVSLIASLAVGGCTSSGGSPGPTSGSAALTGSTGAPSTSTSAATSGAASTPASSASGSSPGGPSGTAVQAFRLWVMQWNASRFSQMHQTLATGQQTLVSARRLGTCESDSLLQGGSTSIKYARTVSQKLKDITVVGTRQRVHATAITAELALDGREPLTRTVTVNWFAQGSAWLWAFDAAAIKAYRRGQCPH